MQRNYLLAFDNIENVMVSPLKTNEQLKKAALELIDEVLDLHNQITDECICESKSDSEAEKSRTYFNHEHKKIMSYSFSKITHNIENIFIYVNNISDDTSDTPLMIITPTFSNNKNEEHLENSETIKITDNRLGKMFKTVTRVTTSQGNKIGIHMMNIVFKGKTATVMYNDFGELMPDFSDIPE